MSDRRTKGMRYPCLGPWPGFIGFCFDEKVFHKEMERLGIKEKVDFLASPHAHASLHHFTSKGNGRMYILALGPTKGRSKEQIAGLIAHEATHIVQRMREDIAQGQPLGDEAEAYIVQMVVQDALQFLWKSNNVRRTEPRP
jgi:hypothetical protein